MKYKVVPLILLLIAIAGCQSQTCPERNGMAGPDRLSNIPKKVLYVSQIPDDMKQTSIGSIYIGAFDSFSGEIYVLKRGPFEKFLTFQYSDEDILLHETGHWIEWYLSTNYWNQWLRFELACEKLTSKEFDSEWFADAYRKICKRGPQSKAEKLVYDLLWLREPYTTAENL
jgi:hypothetical protein